jgi:hypothetical protein
MHQNVFDNLRSILASSSAPADSLIMIGSFAFPGVGLLSDLGLCVSFPYMVIIFDIMPYITVTPLYIQLSVVQRDKPSTAADDMPSKKKPRTVTSKRKTKERTYLNNEEKAILEASKAVWAGKNDKQSRDAYISSEVLPKIQQLNPDRYGADVISKDKASKELWEKRIQVSDSLCDAEHG